MAKGQNWTQGIAWRKMNSDEQFEAFKKLYEKDVIKNDLACWGWKGKFHSNGYGRLSHGNPFTVVASVASWLIHTNNGWKHLPTGLVVCHVCDNPPCTNPDHLFVGTHSDNARDCYNKRRSGLFKRKNVRNG